MSAERNDRVNWSALAVRAVGKSFEDTTGTHYSALQHVSLEVKRGDFYCLLGPSGCGKSTLLNLLAGFESVTTGQIAYVDDRGVTLDPIVGPAVDRSMIFQDFGEALFPWLNVEENITFGPRLGNTPRHLYAPRLVAYLDMVGLAQHSHKYPFELSGGMKQRVQIARALIMEPDILLMDEPFAALDAITKRLLQEELVKIWLETRKTIVYVTHDIVEALLLGNRVAVMTAGPGATIKMQMTVDLVSPREPSSIEFVRLMAELERMLYEEVKGRAG